MERLFFIREKLFSVVYHMSHDVTKGVGHGASGAFMDCQWRRTVYGQGTFFLDETSVCDELPFVT